jgi:hypothetical protein
VNEKVVFDVSPSGGSFASVSEIWSAVTETAHVVAYGSGVEGVSVYVVAGPELWPNDCEAPAGHSIENAAGLAVTLSLKSMTINESTGTFDVPFAGDAPVIDGAVSAGLAVVKDSVWFAAIVSGGSVESPSVTSLAVTSTTHVTPAGSGDVGVSVNVAAGDDVCVNSRGEPSGHSRLKALAEAVTLSLKLIVMVELTETLLAPVAGVVLLTLGALSPLPHGATAVAVLRGAGVPIAKSLLLASVSVQPWTARSAANVVEIDPVGPLPSKQFVPVP